MQGQEMMVPVTTVLTWKFCKCSGSMDGPIKMEVTKVLCQCPSRKSYVVKYICNSGFYFLFGSSQGSTVTLTMVVNKTLLDPVSDYESDNTIALLTFRNLCK